MEFRGVKIDLVALAGVITAISGLLMHLKGMSNKKNNEVQDKETETKDEK